MEKENEEYDVFDREEFQGLDENVEVPKSFALLGLWCIRQVHGLLGGSGAR